MERARLTGKGAARFGRRLVWLVALPLLIAACSGGEGIPTSDVVSTISWTASESVNYHVKSKGGGDVGRITLEIAPQGSSTNLTQRFEGRNTKDVATVTVDARTLKPVSAKREINAPNGDETIEVTYTAEGALIKQGDKQSGMSVPEHAYDNDSSLFLWRTIAFETGFEARYVTIITNRRSKQDVTLRVMNKETVSVPAGSFEAWRLQIRAGSVTQTAWYATSSDRRLLRYDNDNGLIYELEK